jgi:hypothetical protein
MCMPTLVRIHALVPAMTVTGPCSVSGKATLTIGWSTSETPLGLDPTMGHQKLVVPTTVPGERRVELERQMVRFRHAGAG